MPTDDKPKAVQSGRLEDTRVARENDLVAEDFEMPDEGACLDEEAIFGAQDEQIRKVLCPEWGGHVYVRNPSGAERNAFEQESTIRKGRNREMNLRDLKERLVLWFACNQSREPIFDRSSLEKTRERLAKLREKNAAPINRIADVALALGGWTEEDVEELVGNFAGAPS